MRNEIVVSKLLKYANVISDYVEDNTEESFQNNGMLVEACVFNLSQMGELVKYVDKEFEMEHKEIPWRQLYGLRNKIVHDYEGVNLDLVWQIVSEDIPVLINQLKKISE